MRKSFPGTRKEGVQKINGARQGLIGSRAAMLGKACPSGGMPQAQPIQAARLPVTEARGPMSMRWSTGRRRRSDRDPWLGLKVLSIDVGKLTGNPCRDQGNNEHIGAGSIASP